MKNLVSDFRDTVDQAEGIKKEKKKKWMKYDDFVKLQEKMNPYRMSMRKEDESSSDSKSKSATPDILD